MANPPCLDKATRKIYMPMAHRKKASQSALGSPIGSVVPEFIGQVYIDQDPTKKDVYIAYGRSVDCWKKLFDNIPITTNLYVDQNRPSIKGDPDGSQPKPFLTVQEAVDEVAARGDNTHTHYYCINVALGVYNETVTLEDPNLVALIFRSPNTDIGCGAWVDGWKSKADNDNLWALYIIGFHFDDIDFEGASNGTNMLGNDFMVTESAISGSVSCYNMVCGAAFNNSKPNCSLYYKNVVLGSIAGGPGHNPFAAFDVICDTNGKMPSGFSRTRFILRSSFSASPHLQTIRMNPGDTQYAYVESRVSARIGYGSTKVILDGDGSKLHTPAPTHFGGGIQANDASIVDLRGQTSIFENVDLNDDCQFDMYGGDIHGNIDAEAASEFNLQGVHVQGNITLVNAAPLQACTMDGGRYMGALTDAGGRLTRNLGN